MAKVSKSIISIPAALCLLLTVICLPYGVPAKIYSNKIFSGIYCLGLALVLYHFSATFYHGAAPGSDRYFGLAGARNILFNSF